jgi:hypothetical protein
VGETRVDLLHLLEDLRDAYPGPVEETILSEMVANALDSRATRITISAEPAAAAITLVDDGLGMRRRELARYHDIATSAKVRGQGIGFAGVGIKLALLVSREVVTETRQKGKHVATSWALASRHRAPWRWVPPEALVGDRGTAVRLRLQNPLSPLLDASFIEMTLRRHYQALLDPTFAGILSGQYPTGVALVVNGVTLAPDHVRAAESAPVAVRLARKRKPSAVGHVFRTRDALPEDQRGIAVSTLGKVIKQGWDWLGISPATPERIGGLIEVPALAECLTLNKADFIRSGPKGGVYLAYRKAIQEAISSQLATWGAGPDVGDGGRRRAARPVERDLEAVLLELAERFPLLAALVEQRAGGQRRLLPGGPGRGAEGTQGSVAGARPTPHAVEPPAAPEVGAGRPPAEGEPEAEPGAAPAPPVPASPEVVMPGVSGGGRGGRRPGHYGLSIQFEERPGDEEIGRLVESTVWVNASHPAYERAVASRSEGYHLALAVGLALAPLAVEPVKEHAFLISFLTSWGEATTRRKLSGRRTKRG